MLGQLFTERSWQQPLLNVILTLPSIVAFYLRQSIFPFEIGPSYPLRIISPAEIGFQNFWLPLLAVIISLAVLFWLIRRSAVNQLSLTIFFLFLLPSFNINAFHPEQIVHDRYLYLPLLGLLTVVVLSLNDTLQRFTDRSPLQDWKPLQVGVLALLVMAVLSILLLVQTIRYNTAWKTDLALWEWGVQSDPTSISSKYFYGYHLFRNGQLDAAKAAMDTVIENQPLTGPYYAYLQAIEARLERADIAVRQGQNQAAREDLTTVVELTPANLSLDDRANLDAQQQRAFERLAASYVQEEEFETAVQILETARQQLPQLACTFTTNLAVTLYLSGQKERALIELEGIQDRVELEYTPTCKTSLFYLGQLYLELGETTKARSTLIEFLTASETFYDAQTINLRGQTEQLLDRLSG